MTREEAIEYFKMKVSAREAIGNDIGTDYEAYKVALTALRPVSRERVEKVWRGEWTGNFNAHCSLCDAFSTMAYIRQGGNFCPNCGAPMTDEAVDMMMERMREIWPSE